MTIIDDFAHHPTAVYETLSALRTGYPDRRVWAVFEPRSASSCRRVFQDAFGVAFKPADEVDGCRRVSIVAARGGASGCGPAGGGRRLTAGERVTFPTTTRSSRPIVREHRDGDVVVLMSNGGFGGIHRKLLTRAPGLMPAIKEAGDSALLLELEPVIDAAVNARAIAIAAAVREDVIPGVRDVISTYRSVAVYFDPLITDARDVVASLERAADAPLVRGRGTACRDAVEYGGQWGPDLADVAAFAGEVSRGRRHADTQRAITGCSCSGFFQGLRISGRSIRKLLRRAGPRRASGSGQGRLASRVARPPCIQWTHRAAGRSSATPMTRMFDSDQWPAALLSPGDSVRFHAQPHEARAHPGLTRPGVQLTSAARSMMVIEPGLFTTVQDTGRWGHQAIGVPVSGAMDWVAHRTANALVGNEPSAATLETTLAGPKIRFDQRTTVAIAGADFGADARRRAPADLRAGVVPGRGGAAISAIAQPARARTSPSMGASKSHACWRAARRMCSAGWVELEDERCFKATALASERRMRPCHGGERSRTRSHRRAAAARACASFRVRSMNTFRTMRSTSSSGRGSWSRRSPIAWATAAGCGPSCGCPDREMISDAAFIGAIQVPGSGEPILLMADRQTTGGYPQLAIVITADMPLAAQLVPGDWVEFTRVLPFGRAVGARGAGSQAPCLRLSNWRRPRRRAARPVHDVRRWGAGALVRDGGNVRRRRACPPVGGSRAVRRVLVLGGGSNVIVSDAGFDGIVVHVAVRGRTWTSEAQDALFYRWRRRTVGRNSRGMRGTWPRRPRVPVGYPWNGRRHAGSERRGLRTGGGGAHRTLTVYRCGGWRVSDVHRRRLRVLVPHEPIQGKRCRPFRHLRRDIPVAHRPAHGDVSGYRPIPGRSRCIVAGHR